jgi:hypothetical protein
MGKVDWEISLGVFPGILFGVRTYVYEDDSVVDHVLYFGFFDVVLSIYR